MKKALVSAIAVLVLFSASKSFAASFPANLTLQTAQSSLNLKLLFGVINVPLTPSGGFMNLSIEQTGTEPPFVNLNILDGEISVADATVKNLPVVGTATLEGVKMTFTAGGPYDNLTDGNPGDLDLAGQAAGITAGKILTGIGDIDFNTDPVDFTLPSTKAILNETGGPSSYDVTLTIPVSVASTIDADGLLVDALITGTLVFTGTKAIPEPGSVALLGLGLVGIAIPAIKRYRRK